MKTLLFCYSADRPKVWLLLNKNKHVYHERIDHILIRLKLIDIRTYNKIDFVFSIDNMSGMPAVYREDI
jgi:hypothetical protein